MYDTLPIELRMRALCLPIEGRGCPDPIGWPPEGATRLERLHWAIDGRGLPPALKQTTEKELHLCRLMYDAMQMRKRKRAREGLLTKRIKTARKLRSLLSDPPSDIDAIIALDEWQLKPTDEPPEIIASAVDEELVYLAIAWKLGPRVDKLIKQFSAFEIAAGWIIPAIFETHCGSPAGYSRDGADNRIRSEFVDFAEYVLTVLHIWKPDGTPYERRAIEAALTKCRRFRNQ
jgi:hypothetical protein